MLLAELDERHKQVGAAMIIASVEASGNPPPICHEADFGILGELTPSAESRIDSGHWSYGAMLAALSYWGSADVPFPALSVDGDTMWVAALSGDGFGGALITWQDGQPEHRETFSGPYTENELRRAMRKRSNEWLHYSRNNHPTRS